MGTGGFDGLHKRPAGRPGRITLERDSRDSDPFGSPRWFGRFVGRPTLRRQVIASGLDSSASAAEPAPSRCPACFGHKNSLLLPAAGWGLRVPLYPPIDGVKQQISLPQHHICDGVDSVTTPPQRSGGRVG